MTFGDKMRGVNCSIVRDDPAGQGELSVDFVITILANSNLHKIAYIRLIQNTKYSNNTCKDIYPNLCKSLNQSHFMALSKSRWNRG